MFHVPVQLKKHEWYNVVWENGKCCGNKSWQGSVSMSVSITQCLPWSSKCNFSVCAIITTTACSRSVFLLSFSINLLVSYYRVQNCNQLVTNDTENGVLVTRIWRLAADYLSVLWSDIQELVPLQCIFSYQKTSWKTSCVCVSLWKKKIILLTPFGNHIFHLATEKKFQSPVGTCLKKLISNCVLWMLFSDWPCYSLCIWW